MLAILLALLPLAGNNPALADSLAAKPSPARSSVISEIHISGNKRTKEHIITRELTFKRGDTLSNSQLANILQQSKSNLLNTYLFNFVTIKPVAVDSIHVDINIDLKEGWYTWPYPIFNLVDRDFNEWWSSGASIKRIDYGLTLEQHNMRGRNETASISYLGGFDQEYTAAYSMPYITRNQVHGLGISADYFRSHEVAYTTVNDRLYRFLSHDQYLTEVFSTGISYTYRPQFFTRQSFYLGYKTSTIADTVSRRSPSYFGAHTLKQNYLSLSYTFRADYRDYKLYALKGSIFEISLTKQGTGMSFENVNMLFSDISYHKYWPLGGRYYFSSGVEALDIYFGSNNYVSQVTLGYENNYIRGYEPYVISGQHWFAWKNNLKIALIQNKVLKLKFIPTEKFSVIPNSLYFNINNDVAYVAADKYTSELNNRLPNHLLYSIGAGLDYLTYYGWLLRFEYSVNHMGEGGLYLHFTNPI